MFRFTCLLVSVLSNCTAFARTGWLFRSSNNISPLSALSSTLFAAASIVGETDANYSVTNSLSRLTHLHISEYPDDNYSHILGIDDPQHQLSRLQTISALRIADTVRNKIPLDTDGCGIDRSFYVSADDLLEEITEFDDRYGKPLNLLEKIEEAAAVASDDSCSEGMAIAAEFKRASPSKGDINIALDAVQQCMQYADVGAAVISVLTESQHFKGYLRDLKRVRIAVQEKYGNTQRPAILRKDFIFDRYQILEARAYGADTVLLIVAVLGVNQLHDLIGYSRKMGMEPLVEVNTEREMEIALAAGAKVIGVNNRNLHNFQLDMDTTERAVRAAERLHYRLAASSTARAAVSFTASASSGGDVSSSSSSTVELEGAKEEERRIVVAALSGISSSDDVQRFRELGVSCCLIGETLMKSNDPKATITSLLRRTQSSSSSSSDKDDNSDIIDGSIRTRRTLVKACGFTSVADVQVALQLGVNFIGVIFAADSKRRVPDVATAQSIAQTVQAYGERSAPLASHLQLQLLQLRATNPGTADWFTKCGELLVKLTLRKPLLVGVFQDQSAAEVNAIAAEVGLDVVQLHGDESPDFIDQIHFPVIKVLHMTPTDAATIDTDATASVTATDVAGISDDNTALLELASAAQNFALRAVALLLDSRLPGTLGGGTGAVFEWERAFLLQRQFGVPVLLAGGLTARNVAAAVEQQALLGVDVSSGVEFEAQPGVKDANEMRQFISNARSF